MIFYQFESDTLLVNRFPVLQSNKPIRTEPFYQFQKIIVHHFMLINPGQDILLPVVQDSEHSVNCVQ